MFFTKRDRELLTHLAASYKLVNYGLQTIITLQKEIQTSMSTLRAQLDAALDSENQTLKDAALRVQTQIADLTSKLQDALNNLQAAHDSDEDFTAELQQVNDHIASLNQIATTPLAQLANPTGTATAGNTGAAGTTVGGPAADAAGKAAGGVIPPDSNAGSTPTPHDPDAADKKAADTSTLEWGTGDNQGMVRDTPTSDWRQPTQDEVSGHTPAE